MIGPGDKVVCVDDQWWNTPMFGETLPVRGKLYTVREFDETDGRFIRLHEIKNEKRDYGGGFPIEASFHLPHFRRLDISQFRDMAKNADTLPVTERKATKVTA